MRTDPDNPRALLETRVTLSRVEAADVLRISVRSLYSQTEPRGPIPCVRLGARVLYTSAALRAVLDGTAGKEVRS